VPQAVPSAVRRVAPPVAAGLVLAALLATPAVADPPPARASAVAPGPAITTPAALRSVAGDAPSPVHPAASTSTAAPGPVLLVRLVPESRGKGKRQRILTRIDVFSSDGVRRRVRTVGRGGLFTQPALSPDGRRVAFARADGRIAIVGLRDGALRLLRPPGLPAPRPASEEEAGDRSHWAVAENAGTSWSPDGRTVIAHGLVQREPRRWVSTLGETRSVACTVSTGRCTTAGAGAPADLLPLSGGRTLRLDGPAPSSRSDGTTSYGLDSARQERLALRLGRDPVRTAASVASTPTGVGPRRVLRVVRSSARTGVVALGERVTGPAGALIQRRSVRIGPDRSDSGLSSDDPTVAVTTRTLTPWIVSPAGRLSTLPLRLGAAPIGSLSDGRWLLPTTQVGVSGSFDPPEPGLATLDRRGRVRPFLVGGRAVTPVRLALDAGLPDTFAAGADLVSAWVAGDDLLVGLQDTGYDGAIFFPGDSAIVRLPLDGSTPPRLLDHQGGATYDAR